MVGAQGRVCVVGVGVSVDSCSLRMLHCGCSFDSKPETNVLVGRRTSIEDTGSSPHYRYLSLNTVFEESTLSVSTHTISFESESLVRALNGEGFDGQYKCTLVNGSDIETGTVYDVLSDFYNCSTVNGGFRFAGLSTSINQDTLYTYSGSNDRCAVVYGTFPTPLDPAQSLEADALSVGAGAYVRLGDGGCVQDNTCVYVPRAPGMCDSSFTDFPREIFIPIYVTDPDGLDNSNFQFSLSPNPQVEMYFSMNSETGQLSLIRQVDRDAGLTFFSITATVTDSTFSEPFNVGVTIEDVNDNDPMPAAPVFTGSVDENADPLTYVLTAFFTDADAGPNSALTYSIDSTDFIINSTTGEVFTGRVFDFEDGMTEFVFNVTARDGGNRMGMAQVRITINDLNDNRPTLVVMATGAEFVEDSPPVQPAVVTVEDRDSGLYPILYGFVTVVNNLDEDEEVLDIDDALLPPGFKVWSSIGSAFELSNSTILLIVGGAAPPTYSTLLSAVTYENQAELISLPLQRTISYRVCDTLMDSTIVQLTNDTRLAIDQFSLATTSDLTDEEAELLIEECAATSNAVNFTDLVLVETNDRPVLVRTVIEYPPIREDEPNRGSYIVDTFAGAILDTDRSDVLGIAATGMGGAADPTFAQVADIPACRARSDEIIANGSYECAPRLAEGGECYCPEGVYALTCDSYGDVEYFVCLGDNFCSLCTCSLPSVTSDLSAVHVDFGSGDLDDISFVLTTGVVLYTFPNTEQLFNFTFGIASTILTRTDLTTISITFQFTISFESFGVLTEESSLLLNPYTLIRWSPLEDQTGTGYFSFRAWDGSNGFLSGSRGVKSVNSSDTSFSLESGNATIAVTPVNDPPEIRLGGPDQQDYNTTYIEGGDSVFIAARDAVIVELDRSDSFLYNLSIRISTVGGACDLPNYEGVSNDRLSFMTNNMIPVNATISTEGQACVEYDVDGALSVDQWRAYLTMIRFFVTDDEPSEHTREISVVISDLVSTSAPSVTTVQVSLVSDLCPVIELPLSGTPLTYVEHSDPLVLSDTLNVTDPDRLPMIGGATVTIVTDSMNPCVGCQLSVELGTSGLTLSFTGTTLTLSGLATPTVYQEVLRTVAFEDSANEPTFDLVPVRFTLLDPQVTGPCNDASGEIGVMIEHVNDNSPHLYLDYPDNQDYSASFVEGAGRVAVTGRRVEIQDLDGEESSTYRVDILIEGCNPSEDSLEFMNPVPTTVQMAYNSSTCTLVLLGNSVSVESDLTRLRYNNLNMDDPTPSTRFINFTIIDGTLESRTSQTLLTVTAVNDPPEVDLDTSNSVSSDSIVTMILGTESVGITTDNQGSIVDPDTDNLQNMTLVLTEVDNSGTVVQPRTDEAFESLQTTDPQFVNGLGLFFQFFVASGELRIIGEASVGG